MTRDDIIKWVQEARLPYYFPTSGELAYSNGLMRFAELVATAEREECVKIIKEFGKEQFDATELILAIEGRRAEEVTPLYAKCEWAGLPGDEEILEMSKDAWGRDKMNETRIDHTGFYIKFARLIEANLKEKNT